MKREENNTAWEFEDNHQSQSTQGEGTFKRHNTQGEGTFKRQSTQGASDEPQDTEDREPRYSRRVVDYDREKQGKWRKVLVTCGIVVAIASIVVVAASKSNTYPDFMNNVKTAIGTAQSRLKGDRPAPANITEEQRARYQRALDTAKSLPVVELDTKSKYKRVEQFGEAWKDVNGNGCDTRNDILKRDLRDVTTAGRNNCRVTSGVFDDPYTGKTIHFKYGKDTSSEVQIDHVVALHDAWMTGAQKLTQQEREALANDPDNLLAVDGPENQRKGDGLCLNKSGCTGMYLPPNEKYHCEYAAKFTEVKSKYNLGLTEGQKETLVPLLEQCAAGR